MRWFQGQAQLTKWAIFRQFVLELRNVEESLEKIDHEIEKGKAEIEFHQHIAENSTNPGERRLSKVEIDFLERQVARSTRMRADLLLDRHYYLDFLDDMLKGPDGQVPDGSGRTWLDMLYSDEQDEYEKQIWTNRLGKQAALDIAFYGRIGVGNMDAILQMPEDQQAETLVLATDFAVHLKAYQSQLEVDSATRAANGIPLDKKELQFPKPPAHWLADQLGNSPSAKNLSSYKPRIEQSGDDLDVYNG